MRSDMERWATLCRGHAWARPGSVARFVKRPAPSEGAQCSDESDFVTTLCDPALAYEPKRHLKLVPRGPRHSVGDSVRIDAQLPDLLRRVLELDREHPGDRGGE